MLPIKELSQARRLLRRAIEDFFDHRGYLEVETPMIVTAPGTEVYLDYFPTTWIDFKHRQHDRFLRSSPELHLKQALAEGLSKVYHIGKCFRNGGEISEWHHPEFTMLEYYESNISYEGFMDLTINLIDTCRTVFNSRNSPENPSPWTFTKISVYEAFLKTTGIDLVDQDPELAKKGLAKGFHSLQPTDDFETAFFKIMLDIVEPWLGTLGAVILYDYPASQSALAKVVDGKAKRFEVYIDGIEVGNAFNELTDQSENIRRVTQSNEMRKSIGKAEIPVDSDFFDALAKGLPSCCGIAVGFDRLLALLLGYQSIESVIPFRDNQIYPVSFRQ